MAGWNVMKASSDFMDFSKRASLPITHIDAAVSRSLPVSAWFGTLVAVLYDQTGAS